MVQLIIELSMLDKITPVILTLDEELNIGRCLEQLRWANTIVVLDSGSKDNTENICAQYPNVHFFTQLFKNHAHQWSTAVQHPKVNTEWVLTLDADYILNSAFVTELSSLDPSLGTAAYEVNFTYCINGHALTKCLYPSRIVLARVKSLSFYLDGHTQRQKVSGHIDTLMNNIQHDDRKTESQWRQSQLKYAELEAKKLIESKMIELSWSAISRKYLIFTPYLIYIYLGLIKGLWFAGPNARLYIQQRVFFERLLQQSLVSARKSKTKTTNKRI